jgi:hypothetical protein
MTTHTVKLVRPDNLTSFGVVLDDTLTVTGLTPGGIAETSGQLVLGDVVDSGSESPTLNQSALTNAMKVDLELTLCIRRPAMAEQENVRRERERELRPPAGSQASHAQASYAQEVNGVIIGAGR